MENPIENVDAVKIIDLNIIDTMKTIKCRNKRRSNVTASQIIYAKVILIAMSQPSAKGLLTWKIKIKSYIKLAMVEIPTI